MYVAMDVYARTQPSTIHHIYHLPNAVIKLNYEESWRSVVR